MYFSVALLSAVLASTVVALPVPQLAGEGAACNAILSDTDNGVGYAVEDVEDNVAGVIQSIPHSLRRQLAGEGALCNAIFSDTDNGVGHGVEDVEDNIANLIKPGSSGSGGTGSAPPAPPAMRRKRQLDKIANGLQTLSNAAGTGAATSSLTQALDTIDGLSTSGAANLGASIGQAEESTLEALGSSVLKRNAQLDKIANGLQAISNAAGTGPETSALTTGLVDLDGALTSGAANLGTEIGNAEDSILEGVGSSVL